MNLLKEISTNAGLVSLLVLACSFLSRRLSQRYPRAFAMGVGGLFGIMAIVSMQFPVTLLPGVLIDSRTVLSALAGAFYGPWAALAGALFSSLYRFSLGGVGMVTGILILVLAAVLGCLFWWVARRIKPYWMLPALTLLGLLVGIMAVLMTLSLPEAIRFQVFSSTLVPVPIAYIISTAVFGGLLFVVQARRRAEDDLRRNLEEKRLLLRELYHRTKNNMAVIISFLRMASAGSPDERVRSVFDQAEGRIQAMALVHEKLYEAEDLSRIDLKSYLNSLIELITSGLTSGSKHIRIEAQLESLPATIDTAISCGLVVNELLSNAIKHAFPRDRMGTVVVTLAAGRSSQPCLTVADDGIGLPPGLDPETEGGVGLEVVRTVTKFQLHGSYEIASHPGQGTTFRLTLPSLNLGSGR